MLLGDNLVDVELFTRLPLKMEGWENAVNLHRCTKTNLVYTQMADIAKALGVKDSTVRGYVKSCDLELSVHKELNKHLRKHGKTRTVTLAQLVVILRFRGLAEAHIEKQLRATLGDALYMHAIATKDTPTTTTKVQLAPQKRTRKRELREDQDDDDIPVGIGRVKLPKAPPIELPAKMIEDVPKHYALLEGDRREELTQEMQQFGKFMTAPMYEGRKDRSLKVKQAQETLADVWRYLGFLELSGVPSEAMTLDMVLSTEAVNAFIQYLLKVRKCKVSYAKRVLESLIRACKFCCCKCGTGADYERLPCIASYRSRCTELDTEHNRQRRTHAERLQDSTYMDWETLTAIAEKVIKEYDRVYGGGEKHADEEELCTGARLPGCHHGASCEAHTLASL